MFSIGEFSKASALTIKTLRLYHERELLIPTQVDANSGYRYYDRSCLERARIIKILRELEFSLDDIHEILSSCRDDTDALTFVEAQREKIRTKLERYQLVADSLDRIVAIEREARNTMNQPFQIEEKMLGPMLIAGIRVTGRYEQCADSFKRLGRAFGFGLAGKPGNLFYDSDYKEDDADFESFFPIKKSKAVDGVDVRELAGGRHFTLVHRGPYDTITRTYGRIFEDIENRGLKPQTPSREIYIKGPGMIFKGNPARYLTEVQVPVE